MKKGISAIVATVLVVLITVAGVTILWAVVMPMVRDNLGSLDQMVSMQIVSTEGYTSWDSASRLIEVQVKRGSDDAEIIGFGLSFTMGGNTITHYVNDNLAENSKKTYHINLSAYSGDLESIKLSPVFEGGKVGSVVGGLSKSLIKDSDLSGLSPVGGFVEPDVDPPATPPSTCTDDPGCSSAGSFCDVDTPYTCALGGDSCYDRTDGTICGATESCVGGVCVVGCTDDPGCSSAGSFCDVDTPYTCALGGDSCYDRTDGTICGATESCVGGVCVVGCTDDPGCSSAGSFCDVDTPYTCALGGDSCYDRTDGTICGATESCVAGVCVSSVVVPSDYVAYWKFDVDASDETGSYDGAFVNGAGVVSDAVRGGVLGLDGSNDYVNVGSFDPASSGSISFWINLDVVTGAFDRIFGGDDAFEMRAQDAAGGYMIQNDLFTNGSSVLSGVSVLGFGTWSHVVGTYDSSGFKQIYIDGSLDAPGVRSNDDPGIDVLFIGVRTGMSDYIDGYLDDVMIYNRVLTSSEVSNIFSVQTPGS